MRGVGLDRHHPGAVNTAYTVGITAIEEGKMRILVMSLLLGCWVSSASSATLLVANKSEASVSLHQLPGGAAGASG